MSVASLPELPLQEWQDTKTTLHLFSQIVGKVRLAMSPPVNHWWHVPLYVSARGFTTSAIPLESGAFEMELDLCSHEFVLRVSDGTTRRVPLTERSVAAFYREVRGALGDAGIRPRLLARPFDPSRAKSDIPFARDEVHATYDPVQVERYWRALVRIEKTFRDFRGRFIGKCSPVHLFWHSFDLAVTRFSGRPAPVAEGADPVSREAYSHEVISAGFWAGDDDVPEAAFYTYAAPEPKGIADEPLAPAAASWQEANGSHMAFYRYEDYRTADDPDGDLMKFLESSYAAGARRASWPEGLTV